MSTRGGHRVARATAATAITLPCVLLAHLLTAGVAASASATAVSALLVLAVTIVVPARSRAGLALVAGTAQLGAHAVLALLPAAGGGTGALGCLPAVGRGAELGLRLAVLRVDGGCPAGTLAPGASLAGALAAFTTALVILIGHAAVAGLTGVLLAGAETVADRVAALRTAALLVLRPAAQAFPAPRPPAVPDTARRWLRARPTPTPLRRRGPPLTASAPS